MLTSMIGGIRSSYDWEFECAQKRKPVRLTLRLGELALLDTRLDSLVELGIKGTLGREGDLVVCRHILLDGLAAKRRGIPLVHWLRSGEREKTRPRNHGRAGGKTQIHTWNHCAP